LISDFFSDAGEKKARPSDSPRDGSDKVRDIALHSDDRCYSLLDFSPRE
jgi:hypothetical protein